MAQKFNLTAQLQLQANQSNIGQVVSQVQKQLSPLGNIKLKAVIDGRSLAQANGQMAQFNKYTQSSTKSVGELNRSLAESARRFSVITVATGSLLSLVNAFKKSVGAAIEFDAELVKIEQVTGSGGRSIAALSDEVRRLSTTLGVSSKELIGVSRTLLQAGLSAENTKKALDILAKTTLASSFDDIQSTTEGAIAILSQFKDLAGQTGGEIKFLEQSLDAINAVSKAFAVESSDLVEAIRKVGGVFVNTGGDVNELIALFTSVRATTRESAESIATGLRTIFTRIQRGDTVDALQELGIELRDAQGNFVGAFEAVKRLSSGLAGLDPRSFRFSAIVEELGGYRQIGKVIPLINQFTIAQQALNVAQSANGSINKDAQTSQKALSTQIKKVKEQFDELIAKFADSEAFRSIIGGSLKFAEALIKLGSALEPILPLLTTLFALKAGQGLASGIGILRGFTGAPSGIRASKFASGGMVPGSGNRDTVPAMLTPGEFVIRKSSVNKIGAGNLASMNANGYAAGGKVNESRSLYGNKGDWKTIQDSYNQRGIEMSQRHAQQIAKNPNLESGIVKKYYTTQGIEQKSQDTIIGGKLNIPSGFGVSFLKGRTASISASIREIRKESNSTGKNVLDNAILKAAKEKNPKANIKTANDAYNYVGRGAMLDTNGTPTYLQDRGKKIFEDEIIGGIPSLFDRATLSFKGTELDPKKVSVNQLLSTSAIGSMEGQFFEAFIRRVTGNVISDPSKDDIFDFKDLASPDLKLLFGDQPFVLPNEFKNDASSKANIASAVGKALTLGTNPKLFAVGGNVSGSDTVPAMLTPGEFVFNKSAAQSIGYTNLNRMNKTGVQGFAKGGPVGVQKFATGGTVQAGDFGLSSQKDIAIVNAAIQKNAKAFEELTRRVSGLDPEVARAALIGFARNIDKATDDTDLISKAMQSANKSLAQWEDDIEKEARRTEQQAKVKASAEAGQKEIRTVGSVGKGALSGDVLAGNIAYLEKMGLSSKQADKALSAYTFAIQSGKSKQDALAYALDFARKITNEDIEASKKLAKEKKSLAARLGESVSGAAGAVGKSVGKFAGDAGAALRPAAEATRSLQTLAFFATGIAAVTTQTLGLSGAMEQAINQTVATAATLLSLGSTVLDLASNMGTAAIVAGADIQKKAAADLAAKADLEEAAASTQATAADKLQAGSGGDVGKSPVTAGGIFASTLLSAAAAAAIVVTVFQGFAAYWTATADDLSKKTEKSLGKLAETGEGSAAEIQKTVKGEVEARNAANAYSKAAWTGGIAAVGGAALGVAGAVAVGAALGSTVPIVGTVVGALAGLAVGALFYQSAQKAAAEAAIREAQAVNAAVDSLVALYQANNQYKKRLDEINNLPVSEEKKVGLQLQARATGAGGRAVGDVNSEAVKSSSEFLALMSEKTGKSLSELANATDEDLKKLTGVSESERVMIKLRSQEFNTGLKTLSQAVVDSRAVLGQAAQLELTTGNRSFDQIISDPSSKFAQALQQNETLILQEAKARQLSMQVDIANLRRMADSAKTEEERAMLTSQANTMQAEANQIIPSTNKQMQETRQAYQDQSKSAIENRNQMLVEIAARKALFVELNKQKEALNKINQFTKGLQDAEAGVNDFIANLEGNVARVEIKSVDLGDELPLDQLKSNLNNFLNATSSLPQELQAAAREAANALLFSRDLITKNSEKLIGVEFKQGLTGQQILSQIGLDDDSLLQAFRGNEEELKRFKLALQEAVASGGIITPEEADKLFDPIREANEGFANQIQASNDAIIQQLNVFRAGLAAEQAVRDKNIEAADKYSNVVSRGAEVLATARGESTASVRVKTEVESQQRRLNAGQTGRGGTVLEAGNALQLAAAKRLAESQLEASRAAIDNARKTSSGAEVIAKLEREQQQLINTIKDASGALEELANSSAEIDRLTESLDKERQAREQAFGVLKEFVIGGQESRQNLALASQGIFSAIQTGTTQNLPEELRSSVFSLLDKLSDVQIGQTGLTGEQLSKELIVRDAQLLGVDPKLALELATQTTVEKQILNAIENQTKVLAEAIAASIPAQQQFQPAQVRSKGGIIYRAGGGSIFKPRGTDTVPAMLTPGEFVMNKGAVDKYGIGFMQSLNNGNETNYLAEGGKATKDLTREELEAKIKAKELEKQKKRQEEFADKQAAEKTAYEDRMKENSKRVEAKRIEEQQSLQALKAQQAASSEQALRQADADKKRRETERMNQLRLQAEGTTFESLDETQARNILGDEGYQVEKERQAQRKPREEVEAAKWEAQINRLTLSKTKESRRERTKKEKRYAGGINIQNAITAPTPVNNIPINRGIQVAPQIAPQIMNGGQAQVQPPQPQQFVQQPQQVQQIQQPPLQQIQQQAQQAQGFINQQQAIGGEAGGQAAGIVLLQNIFETFSGNLQNSFDNMITAFNTISGSLNNLVAAFSAGMTINHQFSGDMTLAFSIQNGDVLKNQIAEAITPKLKEIITQELDSRLNNFKAGG